MFVYIFLEPEQNSHLAFVERSRWVVDAPDEIQQSWATDGSKYVVRPALFVPNYVADGRRAVAYLLDAVLRNGKRFVRILGSKFG